MSGKQEDEPQLKHSPPSSILRQEEGGHHWLLMLIASLPSYSFATLPWWAGFCKTLHTLEPFLSKTEQVLRITYCIHHVNTEREEADRFNKKRLDDSK